MLFHAGELVDRVTARQLALRLFEAFRNPKCKAPITPSSLLDCSFGGYKTNTCCLCRRRCRDVSVWDVQGEVNDQLPCFDTQVQWHLARWMCAACTDDLI